MMTIELAISSAFAALLTALFIKGKKLILNSLDNYSNSIRSTISGLKQHKEKLLSQHEELNAQLKALNKEKTRILSEAKSKASTRKTLALKELNETIIYKQQHLDLKFKNTEEELCQAMIDAVMHGVLLEAEEQVMLFFKDKDELLDVNEQSSELRPIIQDIS